MLWGCAGEEAVPWEAREEEGERGEEGEGEEGVEGCGEEWVREAVLAEGAQQRREEGGERGEDEVGCCRAKGRAILLQEWLEQLQQRRSSSQT